MTGKRLPYRTAIFLIGASLPMIVLLVMAVLPSFLTGRSVSTTSETVSAPELVQQVSTSFSSDSVEAQEYDSLVPPIKVPENLLVPGTDAAGNSVFQPASLLLPFEHDPQVTFHPHGDQLCASGCAVSNHPTPELSRDMFDKLVAEFAGDPLGETGTALESLLFYGKQTADWIAICGTSPLDSRHASFLLRELEKGHARVSIRIVDEQGNVRASNNPANVPFNRRHVFDLEGNNLQPLVASGTVKRVGLDHLWTRL